MTAILRILAAIALFLAALPALADCEPAQDPSPQSDAASGLHVYNDTQFALRVFWAGFDGFLEPMSDWVQPGEVASYDTWVGHAWFVEVNTPDGAVCSGPIRATGAEDCQMRILYDGGLGHDAGFCDFTP